MPPPATLARWVGAVMCEGHCQVAEGQASRAVISGERKQPGRQRANSRSHSNSSRLQLLSCCAIILWAHSEGLVNRQALEASHTLCPPSQPIHPKGAFP